MTRRPDDAVRLQAKQANVLWQIARHDEARDAFNAALRQADPDGALKRAHLYTRLGRLEMTELGFEAAAAAFDAAQALLGDDPGCMDDASADQWLEIMLDGLADMHVMRLEPDQALAILEAARPVLETRGTPARRTIFDRVYTMQRLLRRRFRVDEADLASLRRSIEAAEQTGEDKDLGYAKDFLGWALWLRGDLAEATELVQQALTMAERIGETHLRTIAILQLMLAAVRRRDNQALRALIPRAIDTLDDGDTRIAVVMSCQAWLAWQDGRPDEVISLAARIAELAPATIGAGARYKWVHMFPAIAARLQSGAVAEASGDRANPSPSLQLLLNPRPAPPSPINLQIK